MKQSRIPSRYEHCEFDSYHPELGGIGREKRDQALATAKKFVQEYPLEKTGLILIGPIGVGKTHLAVSILRELILRKGIPGLFYDYRELLKQVQNSYNASVQITEMDVLRPVFETEVLVLDELGDEGRGKEVVMNVDAVRAWVLGPVGVHGLAAEGALSGGAGMN